MACTAATMAASDAFDIYRTRKYFPALDGIRALSVLAVIFVHMHGAIRDWFAGDLGVVVFFVLSGYLITTLCLREESERGSVSIKAFYIRRCCRIFPLYYLVLGFYAVLFLAFGVKGEHASVFKAALLYYLTYLQEIPIFYGLSGQHAVIPFYQSWSLGIEEKFYLVWPVLGFAIGRHSFSRRMGMLIAIACILLPLPLLVPLSLAGCLVPYLYIGFGCMLAILLNERVWFDRIRRVVSAWSGVIVLAAVMLPTLFAWWSQLRFVAGYPYIGYSLVAACLIAATMVTEGNLARFLSTPFLVLLGKLSYGMYLLHVLALNAAEKIVGPTQDSVVLSIVAYLLACAITVAAAYPLHVFVETPLISYGRSWSRTVLQNETQPAVREHAIHAEASR
jgi:peptidoglycan/LPS O-acetylase OafA/YrhL